MNAAFVLTFCNLQPDQSRRCIGVVEATGERWLIDLPELELWSSALGASGICTSNGNFLVGVQGPEMVLEFGPGLGLAAVRPATGARDMHGLCPLGDRIAIAGTGRDTILSWTRDQPTAPQTLFASGKDADTLHINDLAVFEGKLVASSFGPRVGNGVRSGSVFEVESGKTLIGGLREPHSLCVHDDALYCLESATGALIRYRPGEGVTAIAYFAGYLRGLAMTKEHIAVGRSAFRPRSRSKPGFDRLPPFDSRADDEKEHAVSGLYIGDAKAQEFKFVDLSDISGEIYGVAPIDMDIVRRDLLLADGEKVRNRDLVVLVDQLRATIRNLRAELIEARQRGKP